MNFVNLAIKVKLKFTEKDKSVQTDEFQIQYSPLHIYAFPNYVYTAHTFDIAHTYIVEEQDY